MKIWLMVLCVFTLGACADSMVTNPASNDAVMTDGLNPDAAMADTSDGKEVDGSDPDTVAEGDLGADAPIPCLLYTSPSPRDVEESRMPSSA